LLALLQVEMTILVDSASPARKTPAGCGCGGMAAMTASLLRRRR
jgi:hypothetical protein